MLNRLHEIRNQSRSARRAAFAIAAVLAGGVATAGCSGGERSASAQPATAASTGKQDGGGGGAGGPGGNPVIVLSAADVGTVRRASVEAATPITGNLRPIETVEVRARLEGDLVGVYVREGERVSQGQLLARFEASEQEGVRRTAEAELAAARSQLATAEWAAEQAVELFKAGAVAEQEVKTAQQAVAAASAALAAGEASVRFTGSVVEDTRVISPVSGVVEQRLVQNGETMARGAPMFTVVRNDVLELTASVPARQAGEVRPGQTVRFAADGRAFDGSVARVSPTIDPVTRALTVYIRVPNPDRALRGNTFATGRVVGRTIEGALVVPSAALRQSGQAGESFVYRVAGNVIERTPVRVGVLDEAAAVAQVIDGLNEGDRVIVGNVGTLGSGMRVQVVGDGGER